MQCSRCGTQQSNGIRFCSNCGQALEPTGSSSVNQPGTPSAYRPAPIAVLPERENLGRRILAYLIDLLPCLVLSVLHFLPILGWMMFGLITGCYWLLRDINGASLGKSFTGSIVLSADGSPSTTSQRIIRNAPIAFAVFLEMIPFAGILFWFIGLLIVVPVELLLVLVGGRRLGDVLAGTNVFHKPTITYGVPAA